MADETKTEEQPAEHNAGPGIQVHAQYTKDLSFENPNSPESLVSGWGAPETNVNINIQTNAIAGKEDTFEVVLLFRIESKNKEHDKVAFIVELAYGCVVTIGNVPKENMSPVLLIEIPKLMFPFAREIIAKSSIQGGYPPLYLQPINFEALYMQEAKRQQDAKGEEAPASAQS